MYAARLFITDHNSLECDLAKVREDGSRAVVLNADGNLAVVAVMEAKIADPAPAPKPASSVRTSTSKPPDPEPHAPQKKGA